MIENINIKNFKSIVDLELNLGRVNILIGANGCGKTNILEAITMASAANQDRLEDEYLGARLRLPQVEFMYPEFTSIEVDENYNTIYISIKNKQKLENDCVVVCLAKENQLLNASNMIKELKTGNMLQQTAENVKVNKQMGEFNSVFEKISPSDTYTDIKNKIPKFFQAFKKSFDNPHLDSYLIFSPEETKLRTFNDDTLIKPLGRKGEGLFKHLKELLTNGDKESIAKALNEGLSLLDWFQGLAIPTDLFTFEARIDIHDRFLTETKHVFDQRSTNEGFLFLLFYLTLFNSEKTPPFFAIDNIETSLNPKLSRRLLQHLVEVAKKKNKQVIITTHSPYVLDGLDLSDDEQRLFVVWRNIDGHTCISRVPHRENRKLPLSEVWMSGVLGGLPDNF